MTGNIVSRDNGLSWSTFTQNPASSTIGWNGSEYIMSGSPGSPGSPSYLFYDLSGNNRNIIQLPYVSTFREKRFTSESIGE